MTGHGEAFGASFPGKHTVHSQFLGPPGQDFITCCSVTCSSLACLLSHEQRLSPQNRRSVILWKLVYIMSPLISERLKKTVPWFVKIPAKIVLSRLPVKPLQWQRLNVFRAGMMDTPGEAFLIFKKHFE